MNYRHRDNLYVINQADHDKLTDAEKLNYVQTDLQTTHWMNDENLLEPNPPSEEPETGDPENDPE